MSKFSPFGTPIPVVFSVVGLTITAATPLVYQLPQATVDFDILQILPGTAILNLPSAPPADLYFNSICSMRIYRERLAPFGTQKQGYKVNTIPIHLQQFGTGAPVIWGRDVDIAIEIFTPYNLALGAGSIIETVLIPGNFQQGQAEQVFGTSRPGAGGLSRATIPGGTF